MKKYTVLSLGLLVLAVMPVVKGGNQPEIGSEEYARRLADIFEKKGEAGLKYVIEQEVPEQQREKVSIQLVGTFADELMRPQGTCVQCSIKEKEAMIARDESLALTLIKTGCGSKQERKKIADCITGNFELQGNEVFVNDLETGRKYEDFRKEYNRVVFNGETIVDIVRFKDEDERRFSLLLLQANVRVLEEISGKNLREILAERDAQNGTDKPGQGAEKAK